MPSAPPAWISSASDSFTGAMAAGEMDRGEAILVAALAACEDASHVEAVLFSSGIDEVVFHDSVLWPEVAEVLVTRAQAMAPAEGARTQATPTPARSAKERCEILPPRTSRATIPS